MAEIIEFNKSEVQENAPVDFSEVFGSLLGDDESAEIFKALGAILNLEEEHFAVLKDGFLESFEKSINNPTDKVALVQALNAGGHTAEELIETFSTLTEAIDELTQLSREKRDFLKQLFGIITNAINDTVGIAKKFVQIPVELCHEDAKLPTYANVTDSGMDVYALDDYTIHPGETRLIPTGIKMAIPHGYEIQVRPKSGRALKTKLRVANTPGTIDAGYRDEICVIVENIEAPIKDIIYDFDDNGNIILRSILHGSVYFIGKGEKFCQLVLSEVPKAALYVVNNVGEIGENRGGGFGSTGLK